MRNIYDYPQSAGKIEIYPEIVDGNPVGVIIIGDPEGLRYMSDLLRWLADFDQEKNNEPVGEREHLHLHRDQQLGSHSCEVELCRADAKGTGEFPEFMREG